MSGMSGLGGKYDVKEEGPSTIPSFVPAPWKSPELHATMFAGIMVGDLLRVWCRPLLCCGLHAQMHVTPRSSGHAAGCMEKKMHASEMDFGDHCRRHLYWCCRVASVECGNRLPLSQRRRFVLVCESGGVIGCLVQVPDLTSGSSAGDRDVDSEWKQQLLMHATDDTRFAETERRT